MSLERELKRSFLRFLDAFGLPVRYISQVRARSRISCLDIGEWLCYVLGISLLARNDTSDIVSCVEVTSKIGHCDVMFPLT